MDKGSLRSRAECESLFLRLGKKRQSGLLHLSFAREDAEQEELVILFDRGKIAYPEDAKQVYGSLPEQALVHYHFSLESLPPSEEAISASQFLLDMNTIQEKTGRIPAENVDDVGIAQPEEEPEGTCLPDISEKENEDAEEQEEDMDISDPLEAMRKAERYFVFFFLLGVPLIILYAWQSSFRVFAE